MWSLSPWSCAIGSGLPMEKWLELPKKRIRSGAQTTQAAESASPRLCPWCWAEAFARLHFFFPKGLCRSVCLESCEKCVGFVAFQGLKQHENPLVDKFTHWTRHPKWSAQPVGAFPPLAWCHCLVEPNPREVRRPCAKWAESSIFHKGLVSQNWSDWNLLVDEKDTLL